MVDQRTLKDSAIYHFFVFLKMQNYWLHCCICWAPIQLSQSIDSSFFLFFSVHKISFFLCLVTSSKSEENLETWWSMSDNENEIEVSTDPIWIVLGVCYSESLCWCSCYWTKQWLIIYVFITCENLRF